MTASLAYDNIVALCRDTPAAAIAIEIVAQTGSTNSDLLARAATRPASHGPILLIARQQTAGRGRAGRTWRADGSGLTFSLAWPVPVSVNAQNGLHGLPLAIGVAIAEVLAARGLDVALKWPNDVLYGGGKLAGVLIETARAAHLLHDDVWVVIGIGINMAAKPTLSASQESQIRPQMRVAALPPSDPNILMVDLLIGLTHTLQTFWHQGFAPFVPHWNARHAHAGQAVDIFDGTDVVCSGIAEGVDETGRLLLQTENGQSAVLVGDVSLRPRALQSKLAPRAADPAKICENNRAVIS